METISNSDSCPSVFSICHDVLIYGSGWIGFSAARSLAEEGMRVLLVAPDGALLWESSSALENSCDDAGPELRAWLAGLNDDSLGTNLEFEPSLAEIVAASELGEAKLPWRVLLYAPLVDVQMQQGLLKGVTVATKSGFRTLHARVFVDTSERGDLTRHCAKHYRTRMPIQSWRRMVFHAQSFSSIDSRIGKLTDQVRGSEWLASPLKSNQRCLRWTVGEHSWYTDVAYILSVLRSKELDPDVHCQANYCSMRDFPVYEGSEEMEGLGVPDNLHVLSPALRHEAIRTIADRFELGRSIPINVTQARVEGAEVVDSELPRQPRPTRKVDGIDVLVVGTGTGGGIAALCAARAGANTLAIDSAPYAGGIGTGGAICGYFFGQSGGIQDEIDARSLELTKAFVGRNCSGAWQHDAKKIILHQELDKAGGRFMGDAFLCAVQKNADGRVESVLVVINGELVEIIARTYVDATGDGDLSVLAGADYTEGRPLDGRTLAFSQSAFFMEEGRRGLVLRSRNYDAGWADFTCAEDSTRARLQGLSQYLRPNWVEWPKPVLMAPMLGVRQTRQIVTDYVVKMDDLIMHRKFEDNIGEVRTVADTHSVDYEFESDQLAFYYWVCRGFKYLQYSQLPYRMLLPRGLGNVWLACRASGVENDANYGLRMQREVQRFGEVAGLAANLALGFRGESRSVPMDQLQALLRKSGTLNEVEDVNPAPTDPLHDIQKGLPGVYLWCLYRDPSHCRESVHELLSSEDDLISFYAAAVLAMWGDSCSEPRLVRAIDEGEIGLSPKARWVPGAFGQCIDIPLWLQAVFLLRCNGTEACLKSLHRIAREHQPFNVRTTLACTLERLAARLGNISLIEQCLDALLVDPGDGAILSPSRSLWATLNDEPQKTLPNDCGSDTRQDHSWQLHLVLARIALLIGRPVHLEALQYCQDPRAHVRNAFHRLQTENQCTR